MHRLRARVALLAIAVTVVAGCSGSKPGSSTTSNGGVGPITYASGKDTSGAVPVIINAWNAAHPDQKVTFLELPTSADAQRAQMVTTETAKSSAYDVLSVDVVWTAEFAKAGYIQPVDQSQFDLTKYLQGPVGSTMFEGKMWAAPSTSDGGLLFYRKDILAKEHKQPPKTWDELIADAKTIAPKYGMGGYAGQHAQYEGLTVNAMEAIWAAGGDAITDNGTKVVIDSPQAKAGLGRLADGFKSGWIPKDAITYKEEDSRQAFQNGKLLFLRNWTYVYNLANGPGSKVIGKFGVAPLPGPSALGGHNMAIAKYSKHPKTALDFIKFYTNAANQKLLMQKGSLAPTLASLYDDPSLQKQFGYLTILKDSINTARSRPITPNYNDVTLAIEKEAYAAEQGQKSADQAISDLAKDLNTAINGG